ncbi:MAG: immunoglobulin domain-containing protein [Planctomycetota bacterium]
MCIRRGLKSIIILNILLISVLCTSPVYAVLNNGFETDWLYTSIAWWGDETEPTRGDLIAYDEQTGAVMATLQDFAKWESLCFYGTSANDDARLFVARRATGHISTDITIAELNPSGGTIKSVLLRSLNNAPASIGPQLYVGSLRYSGFHGTFFISLCTDEADPGTALAYEIDLALTTVLNTYTGPGITNPPRISINKDNGRLYMVGTFLIGAQKGRLIEFDTSGGSTSTYNTLIDGDIYQPGDSQWNNPACPIYRGSNHPENNRPTVMVMNGGSAGNTNYPVMEFYLDQTDGNGNLVKRQNAYLAKRSQWQGQVDEYTGAIISVRQFHSDSYDTGIDQYSVDDVHYRPARNDPITDVFLKRGCVDVASPGVAGSGPSNGGSRIISVNPKYDETYPGTTGFEDYTKVQALSYHIHTLAEVNTCLGNTGYGKPLIMSDDGYAAEYVNDVLSFISATAAAGEHYEHFDFHLGQPSASGGGGCMECLTIDGPEDFPADSITIMTALGSNASTLTPGGILTRQGREFLWNGQQVTLMGSGWMGALVGSNFDINGYLDVLAGYNNNLLRVWCVEQWTGTCMRNDVNSGIIPYFGTYGNWDLDQLNNAYFTRAKNFVQAAWDRGIVVQLTLFDRCGLKIGSNPGIFGDSPYNAAMNVNGFLTASGQYPAFTGMDGTQIGTVNQAFIQRLVDELRGYGNVIYEVMNEPHHYWANQTQWHQWVVDNIDDAFGAPAGLNWWIDLGAPDTADGMTNIQVADGDTTPANIGGKECRTNVEPATDNYFYFGIDQLYEGTEPEAYITIEYYDTGTGSLVLQYDSSDPAPFPDDIYKNGGSVALTGSNTWKPHTYHVTDAYFGDRQNGGADFRIAQSVAGAMYLDVVTVVDGLPPTITQHPQSLTLHQNNTAQFTVTATSDNPMQYQWQRNQVDLADGGTISGAQTNTLQIGQVKFSDQADYRCVVSNSAGDATSDSASLSLTVLGDFDIDTDVDHEDFGHLQQCMSDIGNPQTDPNCLDALLDADEFVNLSDFNIFQNCMSGANIPANPTCDD